MHTSVRTGLHRGSWTADVGFKLEVERGGLWFVFVFVLVILFGFSVYAWWANANSIQCACTISSCKQEDSKKAQTQPIADAECQWH